MDFTDTSVAGFPLLYSFLRIWQSGRDAFIEDRTHQKCLELALGLLTAMGRRTISRGICARAKQFVDWSASYRFFSRAKWFPVILEQKLLEHLARHLGPDDPFVVAVDDTHRPKTGRKIPGTSYFYDSKSPRFARSFKWQMRFLSLSVLLTPLGPVAAAKGILLKLKLAPILTKLPKRASDEQKAAHKKLSREWSITTQLVEQLHLLRAQMDAAKELAKRLLVVVADSSYTNKTVIRNLAEGSILIGRTRKDLALYAPVRPETGTKGRKKLYGERLAMPEEFRQNEQIPYQTHTIFAAGNWHALRYKSIAPVLWKSAGANHPCRLIVIAPLQYRISRKSKLLYRRAAYLLVSEPAYSVHLAIQHYFHRWEIEVNHRSAKTTLGVGDAQVTNPRAVSRQFAFAALVGSWLEVAALDAYGPGRGASYTPLAKWRNDPRARPSTPDVLTRLRLEILGYETGGHSCEFRAHRGLAPNAAKYAQEAFVWLAETVPKGLSQSFWSSVLYADA